MVLWDDVMSRLRGYILGRWVCWKNDGTGQVVLTVAGIKKEKVSHAIGLKACSKRVARAR